MQFIAAVDWSALKKFETLPNFYWFLFLKKSHSGHTSVTRRSLYKLSQDDLKREVLKNDTQHEIIKAMFGKRDDVGMLEDFQSPPNERIENDQFFTISIKIYPAIRTQ